MSESSFVGGITRVPIEVQEALGLKNGHRIKWFMTEGALILVSSRPPTEEEIAVMKEKILKNKRD